MSVYSGPDGALVIDGSGGQYVAPGGTIFFGAPDASAGLEVSWTQAADFVSASAESTIEATASFSQFGDTIAASILFAGEPPAGLTGAIDGIFVYSEWARSAALANGGFVVPSGALVPDHIADVLFSQDDNTLTATADLAAFPDRYGPVSYTQDGNTLSATVEADIGTYMAWTQADQAASATTLNKELVLTATGQVVSGLSLLWTQADNTTVADLQSGDYSMGWQQADNTIAAILASTVRATAAINAAGDTISSAMTVFSSSTRWVELYLFQATGAKAAVTAIRYAFWDQTEPSTLDAPVSKGVAAIDEEGRCRIVLEGSTLQTGDTGYIALSDTAGSPDQPWKQFSGPVRVR